MKKIKNEDWEEIGELTKKINDNLTQLIILSSKGMRTKQTDSLKRSARHLNKFRSDAENIMFSKGIDDKNIFYGDSDA